MIRATDIHSLTDFTRNAKAYIQHIKETKSPMAVTVNGCAEVVVQDAASYQAMVDELDRMDLIAALRESEIDILKGNVYDMEEVFAEVRAELDL